MHKILAMGAEAHIILDKDKIIKERIKKNYRISNIDNSLRKKRTRSESKILNKARGLVNCPKVFKIEEFIIEMEYIKGPQLKEVLDDMDHKKRRDVCKKLGKNISELHKYNIIHGDLTTSNMIFSDEIYFIDFGLGFISLKIEDKAVDLLLLKRALFSKHPKIAEECFKIFLKNYEHKDVVERLKLVESRGRYKKKT